MRDVLDDVFRRWSAGETVGLGTVVATFSSAPRAPGAAMVVAPDGTVAGSVSGGCVEGAVYELAQEVVAERKPVSRLSCQIQSAPELDGIVLHVPYI